MTQQPAMSGLAKGELLHFLHFSILAPSAPFHPALLGAIRGTGLPGTPVDQQRVALPAFKQMLLSPLAKRNDDGKRFRL